MNINLPPKVRKVAYAFTALGTPVVAYLQIKGILGDAEAGLWAAEVTVVSILATFNTSTD